MKEVACKFGAQRQLAGIVTEPEGRDARRTLILVSAGLVPKFGPYRLYAQIARRLAREGIRTLRFDLGGIGESRQAYTQDSLATRTEREVRAAVDWLAQHSELKELRLGGLCSGAEDSFRYAENDARVTGVVMIDPFGYRTAGWAWSHLVHRATRRTLRALGVYQPYAPHTAATPTGPRAGSGEGRRLVSYKYMERPESTRILAAMLARRASVHFIYTGGMRDVFNHEGQLRRMFPGLDFQGLVSLDHFPHMEHTQLLEEDRRTLVEAIARRMTT